MADRRTDQETDQEHERAFGQAIRQDGPADGLMDGLVQVAFGVMAVLNRVGAQNDLSLTQLRVLAILRDRRVRMAALAGHLGLEKSTMTGLVDRAEKRGLLQRAPSDGDGRAVDVFLTAAGAGLAERLTLQVARSLSPMTGTLTTAEQRHLHGLLGRMLEHPPAEPTTSRRRTAG
jgi:DNA-binding MarR family transcriptional regulator